MMPQSTQTEPLVYRSLGLDALLGLLNPDKRQSILDLGPALGSNVEFWSQYPCRLTIADLYSGYREKKEAEPEDSPEAVFASLLRYPDDTAFDIILAWDLLNYLDLAEIEALVGRLVQWCRHGTLLFGLILSAPQIPVEPTVFRILDRERMQYEPRSRESRACPRHQPRDIARIMALFQVSGSFLLRHGVQEYVFSYAGTTTR